MNVELVFAGLKDQAGGWKLDPSYLMSVQSEIEELFSEDVEDIPSLEQIEMVLLAVNTKEL